jgi:hypothetical protein
VSAEQHFAEKLHALTRDYGARPNTRIKDLVDLVLLIDSDLTAGPTVVAVARHVFTVRATHPLPVELPDPPSNWQQGYEVLAADLNTPVNSLRQMRSL